MILARCDADGFSEAKPEWTGKTTVLIAGGPSLALDQIAQVEAARAADRIRVIAINDAFLWAPFADILYAADSQWWLWTQKGTAKPGIGLSAKQVAEKYEAFPGERCSIQHAGAYVTDPRVHKLKNLHFPHHGDGLSLNPRYLVTARNSGYQAINLAVLAGSRRLLLLGYDGRAANDGRSHWFGEHPVPTPAVVYEHFRKGFSAGEKHLAQAGVTVLNCSPGTYIDSFPKVSLQDALAGS